ncbi:unnamed protein product [Gongylonema pulchrum]|uniref:Uncharacterized protein n=1 Tax=Gongylonema pulchrum TaxID=637853 RepID=A0A183EQT7_9BILA|nr:unnamed protein product [Gongylonema pulchrum]
MGQFLEKFINDTKEAFANADEPKPSQPKRIVRRVDIDPRSPSAAIPRTPIEVESTPKSSDSSSTTPVRRKRARWLELRGTPDDTPSTPSEKQ